MKRTNDLGRDAVFPLVLRLAVPTMLAQLVNVLYSIVDRMYIGAGVGSLALAGVGVCAPIVTLLSSFGSLVGMGGSPLMAMRMGEGNVREARRILNSGFLMLLVLSVALTVVFLFSKEHLLMWFGASQATVAYADTYITIYTAGTFFALMAGGMNSFLIAQGFSGLGMATVVLGAVLGLLRFYDGDDLHSFAPVCLAVYQGRGDSGEIGPIYQDIYGDDSAAGGPVSAGGASIWRVFCCFRPCFPRRRLSSRSRWRMWRRQP